MKVAKKDNTFAFDVDQTLIIWCAPGERRDGDRAFNYYGQTIYAVPHIEHIQLLMAMVERGRFTVCWSGNGVLWCQEVLRKLELDHLDIFVMSKPVGYCDDVPVENWIGQRVYLNSNRKE